MKFLSTFGILRVAVLSAFVFSFAVALTVPISDPDLFWHLATGKWIWEHKALPDQDPFSFMISPDVYSQSSRPSVILKGYWLGQLVLYGSYMIGDYWGIIALRVIIYGLIVLVLTLWLREIGLDRLSMLLFLIPVAYALTKYIGDRPNQLSYLFSIFSFYLLF